MKKTLWMTAALLTLCIGAASAQLNLSWTDCGTFGAADNIFACNTNSGAAFQLISSFIAPPNVDLATGGDCGLDMQSADPALPPWWTFGGCRAAATLSFSSDFSLAPGTGNCDDLFGSALGGGFNFPGYGGPNRQRFKHGYALAQNFPAMTAGNQVYFSRIQIGRAGTTGAGSCAGCLSGACIVLNYLNVTQDPVNHPGGNFSFTAPADRNYVTWRGNANGALCPDATPARKTSWGTIKTLYR